jgi:hypothetical protein
MMAAAANATIVIEPENLWCMMVSSWLQYYCGVIPHELELAPMVSFFNIGRQPKAGNSHRQRHSTQSD